MEKEKLEVKELNEKDLEQVSAGGPPTEEHTPFIQCPIHYVYMHCPYKNKSACTSNIKNRVKCRYD